MGTRTLLVAASIGTLAALVTIGPLVFFGLMLLPRRRGHPGFPPAGVGWSTPRASKSASRTAHDSTCAPRDFGRVRRSDHRHPTGRFRNEPLPYLVEPFGGLAPGKGQRTLPLSEWVALAAWGSRVVLLAPSAQGPTFTAVEATEGGIVDLLSDSIAAPRPAAGALTTLREHLLVATTHGNTITVQQSSRLSLDPEASAALTPHGYQGKLVSIAAGRERVAVAWLNADSVPKGSSPGGWALLDCKE